MSSFRPDPSLIGPDGYLKDTPDAKKFIQKVKKFNEKLYAPPAGNEALGVMYTCYACEDGKPKAYGYDSLKYPGGCSERGQAKTPEDACLNTDVTKVATAGLGDNKMIIYLVVGGIVLWYLNKEGYLKKILK